MGTSSKPCLLLLLLLVVAVFETQRPRIVAEARTISFLPQERFSKIFPTLGLVCKCCDGNDEGECASKWTGSCHKLQCLPWKIG